MATSSLTIFESLTKEFRCDTDGNGFISLRGLARLCGVRYQTWGQGDSLWTTEIDAYLTECGFEVTVWNGELGIPDTLASMIIGFYAEEKQNPTAKQYSRAFRAYGLRKAIQDLLGYTSTSIKTYTLDMVVRREPASWERMFHPEWITLAEKLTGWDWSWQCMGQFINNTCYDYLPSDVVGLLKERNPKNEDGRGRIHKHHQFLQLEIRNIISKHLDTVETLMSAANGNMDLFKLLMVNKFGRFKLGGSDDLPLFKTQTVFILNVAD